jgi:NAD(P)-dependent dehydrogenase (short-subunit alcohol dehydrogenase family)
LFFLCDTGWKNQEVEHMASTNAGTSKSRGVAVITGATLGLGHELALELARRGWRLIIDGRREDLLDATVAEVTELTTVRGIPGDVSDATHRRDLAAAAAELGPVDLVVNNASTLGASPLPRVLDATADVVTRTYAVNVAAPIALLAALRPSLVERPTVINVTSDAGAEAYETWGIYGSSKAALEHVSRVLAEEEPTWRVLVVDPGDMRTEMHQAAFPGEDISDRPHAAESVPGLLGLIEGDQPSGRYLAREVTTGSGAAR